MPQMDQKIQLKADIPSSGKRLDHFLAERYPDKTRSHFTRLIRTGHVLVNGKPAKSGYQIRENDSITISIPDEKQDLLPADIPLDIVYEDSDILVVNKPAGMVVHPGKGTGNDTLVNALLFYTQNLSAMAGGERPGIVHRLDKNTSGLMVVARNDSSHVRLREQFDQKTISRIYSAIVWGRMPEQLGTIETFIERSRRDPTLYTASQKGKKAISHYRVISDFQYVSHIELHLETGRTHQIRVHMKHIHHPLVGDPEYGGRHTQIKNLPPQLQKRAGHLLLIIPHQALHARQLSFLHPRTGQPVVFKSPLPAYFQEALTKIPRLFLLEP